MKYTHIYFKVYSSYSWLKWNHIRSRTQAQWLSQGRMLVCLSCKLNQPLLDRASFLPEWLHTRSADWGAGQTSQITGNWWHLSPTVKSEPSNENWDLGKLLSVTMGSLISWDLKTVLMKLKATLTMSFLILHIMKCMNIFRLCKKWTDVVQMTHVSGNTSLWVKHLFKVQKETGNFNTGFQTAYCK